MINEKNWIRFFESFSESKHNQSFIQEITKQIPNLTDIQFKVCAYLRAGHSTVYIAKNLNISSRAVENHRYRLRKKFKLDRSENLAAKLMRL